MSHPHPHPHPIRRAAHGLLTAAGLILATALPASAQDLYTVANIAVEETADSEVEAKQRAVAAAKREAFVRLLDRLTLPPEPGPDGAIAAPPPVPEGDRLEFMIRDLSFPSERYGGGRYLADVTVRFQPRAVNQYLQRSGTAYLAAPSPLTVILPVFKSGGGDLLWSDENPWLDAWWSLDGPGTVVPYTVPLGDLGDLSAVDAQSAVAVDAPSINAIAARYSAGSVAVPIATFGSDGGVLVELAVFGAGWPPGSELLRLGQDRLAPVAAAFAESETGVDPNSQAALLHAAAAETLGAMERRWKQENILRFDGEAESVTARVALSGLEDWLAVRAALDSAAPVTQWSAKVLAARHADVEIFFVGEQARLNRALARSGLVLREGEDGSAWVLARR
jgi:hypothetical protein